MIQPGGQPGMMFDKSSKTRFNNTQAQAARGRMVGNKAAQSSVRNQTSRSALGGPPVGPQVNTQQAPQGPIEQMGPAPVEAPMPTGGPRMPEQPDFDPAIFMEQALDEIVGQVRTNDFLESPRVKDAMTKIRLKNAMNAGNPRYQQDPRPLMDQVIDLTGLGRGRNANDRT